MANEPQPQQTPVVPLEAGAGPDNPPCPACGEPLFGWIDQRAGLAGPVSRCESCGLGVVGEPGELEEALRDLDRLTRRRDDPDRQPRPASPPGSAAPAGRAWSPARAYLYTAEAVRRLVANRDQVVDRGPLGARRPGSRRCGRRSSTASPSAATSPSGRSAEPRRCRPGRPWQRRLDAVISVVVAIPAMLFAVPLELIAAALRRGGALNLRLELL